MMNDESALFGLAMVLHGLFCLAFLFAVASALIWMVRFANKAELKKVFWTCLVVGGVGILLTGLLVGGSMMRDWDRYDSDYDREGMMDWDEDDKEESEDNEEVKDEESMQDQMEEMMDTSEQ